MENSKAGSGWKGALGSGVDPSLEGADETGGAQEVDEGLGRGV